MRNKKHILLIIALWAAAIASSAAWNIYSVRENNRRLVRDVGRTFFKEIETTRLWNANHGGVYVPITEKTKPNPYLKIPERDIAAVDGKKLTMINPAFMTRQIAELAETESDIQYHITSLNPIRPANKADEWESQSLRNFENDGQEALAFFENDTSWRYMAPLVVKPACLKCHAEQGYKVGDIRGGISITIPGETYENAAFTSIIHISSVHLFFWMAGMFSIYKFISFRDGQLYLMKEKNEQLEQSRERLLEAKSAAEAAAKAKAAFLSNMSHEIRTPMNSVIGFLGLTLEEPDLPTSIGENLRIVYNSANSLMALIDNILDAGKLESGKMSLVKKAFDLRRLIEETVQMMQVRAAEKFLNLDLGFDSELPRFYRGDALQLRRILLNLVGNAVKFTDKGGVSVWVKSTENGKKLHFEIQDSGIGIPADRLEKIFDPFTQVDSSTSRRFGGAGLGATISKQLVHLMGGEIWTKSDVGKGTVLHFTVRLETVDETSVAAADESVPTDPPEREKDFQKDETPLKLCHSSQLSSLFRELLEALDQYSPENLEPVMAKLEACLPGQQTDPIRQQMGIFKFADAKSKALELASALGIKLEV